MDIQKLNWAGLKLSVAGKTILIDAVEDFSYYRPVIGAPIKETLLFTDETKADYILFTHMHIDHFDIAATKKCLKPDGKIIVYAALNDKVQEHFPHAEIIALGLDELYTDEGIDFKPVFAMDGIGDVQCSWIVAGGGVKIFHGGDTIWHNQFWKLGKENAHIDYAFLPANGVVVHFPMIGLAYSPVPASLTLEQAFAAAHLLNAGKFVPMHYGLFAHPQYYIPGEFTVDDLDRLSDKTEQAYVVLDDGGHLK